MPVVCQNADVVYKCGEILGLTYCERGIAVT